ncbi:MAG: zinc ribbon domain-containing protein, partial [Chloroflexi bacterium]|nr:zinc ribbon domain-containing protein [Chloroflexota bacterium]
MPVYEYRCPQCRRKSAVFVRGFGGADAPACEHCGGQGLTRLFSTFAVRPSQSGSDGF